MKTLQAATFSEDQAGAMIEAIDDAQRHLATKNDMEKMEHVLRTDMEKMETGIRHDMKEMELRLRGEIKDLRAEMHAEFKKLYWYIPLIIGVAASLLGVFSPS